jgi:hypothetical protein
MHDFARVRAYACVIGITHRGVTHGTAAGHGTGQARHKLEAAHCHDNSQVFQGAWCASYLTCPGTLPAATQAAACNHGPLDRCSGGAERVTLSSPCGSSHLAPRC